MKLQELKIPIIAGYLAAGIVAIFAQMLALNIAYQISELAYIPIAMLLWPIQIGSTGGINIVLTGIITMTIVGVLTWFALKK